MEADVQDQLSHSQVSKSSPLLRTECDYLVGDSTRLAQCAGRWLFQKLRSVGNGIGFEQQAALWDLLESMADQATGVRPGRFAYALPAGGGKTTAIVALISAACHLRLDLTFAVATGRIAALCDLHDALLDAGVPSSAIGIWHSDKAAAVPPTQRPESRQILLMSHERIRQCESDDRVLDSVGSRSLIFWDESLVATQARSVSLLDLRKSRALLDVTGKHELVAIMSQVLDVMQGELDRLSAAPNATPHTFDSVLSEADLSYARSLVEKLPRVQPEDAATYERIKVMLDLVSFGVSVTDAGRGESGVGLMRYSVKVPDALTNIAILDASHTIRELTRDGRTKDKTSATMLRYKSYANVTVRGVKLPASKTALRGEGTPGCAKEVLNAIDATEPDEAVLIFTHKATLQRLKNNMHDQGWDEDAMLPDGKTQRVSFLTWGQETSSNDWTHIGHVIMAGVMRRDPLDLAASLTAQQRQTRQHSRAALDRLNFSEMAHCALQAMHRGRCRLADEDGCAKQMQLTLIDSDADGIRAILLDADCLPGVEWPVSERSQHATRKGTPPKSSDRMRKAIADVCKFLRDLSGDSVSKAALTNAVVALAALHKNSRPSAIAKALTALELSGIVFEQTGRKLVRA